MIIIYNIILPLFFQLIFIRILLTRKFSGSDVNSHIISNSWIWRHRSISCIHGRAYILPTIQRSVIINNSPTFLLFRNHIWCRSPQGQLWGVRMSSIEVNGIMSMYIIKCDIIGPFRPSGLQLGVYLKLYTSYMILNITHRGTMHLIQTSMHVS